MSQLQVGSQLPMTFFLIKPDAVRRRLIGPILNMIEGDVTQLRMINNVDKILVFEHYWEHRHQDWFYDLVDTIAGKTVVVGTVSYDQGNAVAILRSRVGSYASPEIGTIRHRFAVSPRENSIHSSDSADAAIREAGIWLK